jgi:hypothetical protein
MAQNPPLYILAPRQRYDTFSSPGSSASAADRQLKMNSEAKKKMSPKTALAVQKMQWKELFADPLPNTSQKLADAYKNLPDMVKFFPEDKEHWVDQINPLVHFATMASDIARFPLDIEQGNYANAAYSVLHPMLYFGGATFVPDYHSLNSPEYQRLSRYIDSVNNAR